MLNQVETAYDANGNALLIVNKDRFHDTTATGELSSSNSRVSYVAGYYDAINRTTAVVNVGTNGGSSYTRPGSVPSRSDTVLVTSQSYGNAGFVETVTDPRGIVTKLYSDALGRTTKTVDAYTDGTPTDNTNKTTEYTYDGAGHVLTLTALLPNEEHQTTEFVYGVTTTGGSGINSNELLVARWYPDPDTGDASEDEEEAYTVNALGQPLTGADRNGSVHTYSYDVVGRLTVDAVTTLGSGVDGAVRRREAAYDAAGLAYLLTNYDAATAGNVVNQVQQVYNGLGQLIAEYQAHGGAVNTSTTPKVQYAYSEMAGGANHSRLTSVIYPNGRDLGYNYATGLDSSISRLTSILDGSTTLEAYEYSGLSTVVRRAHPEPEVDLTYINRSGESNGDAGDQYIGLDRFGRVVDQRWLDPSTGTATDRFQSGYDRNNNRLFRKNLVDAAFSELYHSNGSTAGYAEINQLIAFARGTLSDSNSDTVPDTISSPSRSQAWESDALGNWMTVTTNSTDQDREHNFQNEITSIEGLTTPAYDGNGNLTLAEAGNSLVYDSWNRVVAYKDGSTTLVSYSYDAVSRRVLQDSGTARHLYYSSTWQVLEEREDDDPVVHYVWSPVYVDALVLRDRDTDAIRSLDERLYVHQDGNWNVTAIVNASGAVQERYLYDPYGRTSVLTPSWSERTNTLFAWSYYHQGGRYDSTASLYHFRLRDYSPAMGRWIQSDPIGFAGGDSNLYAYVRSNPLISVDPVGLQAAPGGAAKPAAVPGGAPKPPDGGGVAGQDCCAILGEILVLSMKLKAIEKAWKGFTDVAAIASFGSSWFLSSNPATKPITSWGGAAWKEIAKEVGKETTEDLVKAELNNWITKAFVGTLLSSIAKELLKSPLDPVKACKALAQCESQQRGILRPRFPTRICLVTK